MDQVKRVQTVHDDYFSFGPTPSGLAVFHRYNQETGKLSQLPHFTQKATGELHGTDTDKQKVTNLPVEGGRVAASGKRGKKTLKPVPNLFSGGFPVYARGTDGPAVASGRMQGEPLSPRTVDHLADNGAHRLAGLSVSAIESIPTPSHIAALRPQPALAPTVASSSSDVGRKVTEHKDGEGF